MAGIKCPFEDKDRLGIILNWYPDSLRQDIDSPPKTILDNLQKCGIIKNDNRFDVMQVIRTVDKNNPRVEIEIEKLN